MNLTQKCQYALRAVFELAKRHGLGPTPISEIARAQAMPARFLELILGELKHGGFVESRRGSRGGYQLSVSPNTLAVGRIMRFVDGPLIRVHDDTEASADPVSGSEAFRKMWGRARDAVGQVYDQTTFQDLIDEDLASGGRHPASYCI